MAIQSAVACSEAKDDGLLVSWQLMACVRVGLVSSTAAVEDGFLFIKGQMWWGLLLFPSFVCKLICCFISPNAGVCWYPQKKNTGRLGEGPDVLHEFFFSFLSRSTDTIACRANSESVRKTAFLGFFSHKLLVSVAFSSARTSAM